MSPLEAFAAAYFGNADKTEEATIVWEASRGFGGKSTLLALLGTLKATLMSCEVDILGGSQEQSTRVHEHAVRMWNAPRAPSYLLASDPALTHTILRNGGSIRTLAASQKRVRGPHPPLLLLDEVDEMELSIFDAALGQPMAQEGFDLAARAPATVDQQTVISSTHQHADGTFTEVKRRAAANGWPIYRWCYRETLEPHGWLKQRDVAIRRTQVTADMWESEFELHEPSAEGRAIQPAAVQVMFRRKLGEFKGAEGEYIETHGPDHTDGLCATGADWAKEQDYTVITTVCFRCRPAHVAAFKRMRRRSWGTMEAELHYRMRRYGGRALHDKTGVGNRVDDNVKDVAGGFLFVGAKRTGLLTDYIAQGCEQGGLVYPMISSVFTEHLYASSEDVYGGGKSHHLPDTIAAGALAWRAGRQYRRGRIAA